MALFDPHSYADDSQPLTQSVELELRFNFQERVLTGAVTLRLDRKAEGMLDLDSRGLKILAATDPRGAPLTHELGPTDPIKGQRLRIHTTDEVVVIGFQTSPVASALQWLEPAQTAGGKLPYVFTQCQSIHARSIFPCQDTPKARIRYSLQLNIPISLRGVAAARHIARVETADGRAIESFEMNQPIPPYLFAFAVGDLAKRELGPRSAVYAEPAVVDEAAWEFGGVDEMIVKAESLFGPYDWERFDILLMPPSFPYGGMENPRLTFLTPTLLAKDRSLVSVVAHELAHSWTGNLVTNATLNDFWLNEGFTTYAERRIIETLEGEEDLALHAALGKKGLENDIARFGDRPELTKLRTKLDGVDPDEVFSRVPYEKGYFFLRRIEEAVGRTAFDRFLRAYIDRYRFKSIDTEDFLRCLKEQLPVALEQVKVLEWIDQPGLPGDVPSVKSARLDHIDALVSLFNAGTTPSAEQVKGFNALDWQILLSALPRRLSAERCRALDERFHFTDSHNAEIKIGWLVIAAGSDYEPAFAALESTLSTVGRMKYLRPLYIALLGGSDRTRALAIRAFTRSRTAYHPVAQAMVEGLLAAKLTPVA